MDGNNIGELERRVYKGLRKSGRIDTQENSYGGNFQLVERDYYGVYMDYLVNLIINLIRYDNVPITLDARMLEAQLRMFGLARIGGTTKENLHMMTGDGNNGINPTNGMYGYYLDPDQTGLKDSLTGKKLKQITRMNADQLKDGYVIFTNKYSYYFNGSTSISGIGLTGADLDLIDRTAKTLAKIKATANANLSQMKTPYVGFSKNKNISALNIMQQISQGKQFISLNAEAAENITDLITIADLKVPNFLPALKDEWNNCLNELLTFLGIYANGVDKKERLVSNEAGALAQLTEASSNIYLNTRQQQLDLINHVFGSNITVKFDQNSYAQLVQLKQPDSVDDTASVEEDPDNE